MGKKIINFASECKFDADHMTTFWLLMHLFKVSSIFAFESFEHFIYVAVSIMTTVNRLFSRFFLSFWFICISTGSTIWIGPNLDSYCGFLCLCGFLGVFNFLLPFCVIFFQFLHKNFWANPYWWPCSNNRFFSHHPLKISSLVAICQQIF